jgi:hypothetical protein
MVYSVFAVNPVTLTVVPPPSTAELKIHVAVSPVASRSVEANALTRPLATEVGAVANSVGAYVLAEVLSMTILLVPLPLVQSNLKEVFVPEKGDKLIPEACVEGCAWAIQETKSKKISGVKIRFISQWLFGSFIGFQKKI